MATKRSQSKARKPRSDAQRNRERILEVAKRAFSQSGVNASLDEVAKRQASGGISPEMAVRLSSAFDTSAESWLKQQVRYDLWHAERKRNRLHVTKLTAA